MDENERNHLLQRIRELEQSNRRWKVVTVFILVAVSLFAVVSGGTMLLTTRTAALRAEEEARRQAEEVRRQAEQARALEMQVREEASATAANRQEVEKLLQEKEKLVKERAAQKTSPKDSKTKN